MLDRLLLLALISVGVHTADNSTSASVCEEYIACLEFARQKADECPHISLFANDTTNSTECEDAAQKQVELHELVAKKALEHEKCVADASEGSKDTQIKKKKCDSMSKKLLAGERLFGHKKIKKDAHPKSEKSEKKQCVRQLRQLKNECRSLQKCCHAVAECHHKSDNSEVRTLKKSFAEATKKCRNSQKAKKDKKLKKKGNRREKLQH